MILIIILLAFSSPSFCVANAQANILILYSGEGIYANQSDTLMVGSFWYKHLLQKQLNDRTWPFNSTVEFFDVQSNQGILTSFLNARLRNIHLPNVTVIIGPESAYLGNPTAKIAVQHGIPVVYHFLGGYASAPNLQVVRPPFMATSYTVYPPAAFFVSTLIDLYSKTGVKTLVVVYVSVSNFVGEANACISGAGIARNRGIQVLAEIPFTYQNTTDEIYHIITHIRDDLTPDAILWCESQTCISNIRLPYHPLPLFKKANYMPKAFTLKDCLDYPLIEPFYNDGLYDFVSGGQLFNSKAGGADFTEDDFPYSSVFRPTLPAVYTVLLYLLLYIFNF